MLSIKIVPVLVFLILPLLSSSYRRHSFQFKVRSFLDNIINSLKCDFSDLIDTYDNEVKNSPYADRSVSVITSSWQSTFPNGDYQTNTKNTIPYQQMPLRGPDTILRMAEYQAMVYCKPSSGSPPSDISAIENMANKNLRVGEFVIEATGFDKDGYLFWYIASNAAQQSIILVHRGTVSSNHNDVWDDLDRSHLDNSNGVLNSDFPSMAVSSAVYTDIGFYQRFENQKSAIASALRTVLQRYSNPAYSFIVVGHSLGAAWAFLNAGYFTSQSDINQRMTAVYTFGQPLLGSASFVDEVTRQLNTPTERYVRVVNGNDLIPHIGCTHCIQPEYANEKWISTTSVVTWNDCQGGEDMSCSSGVPCNQLSWSNHSAVGKFSMRGEFCRIASNN